MKYRDILPLVRERGSSGGGWAGVRRAARAPRTTANKTSDTTNSVVAERKLEVVELVLRNAQLMNNFFRMKLRSLIVSRLSSVLKII